MWFWKKIQAVPRQVEFLIRPPGRAREMAHAEALVLLQGDIAMFSKSGSGWRLRRCGNVSVLVRADSSSPGARQGKIFPVKLRDLCIEVFKTAYVLDDVICDFQAL